MAASRNEHAEAENLMRQADQLRNELAQKAQAADNAIAQGKGEVTSGNTGTDTAPVNPATGQPYFSLAAIGWGSGWAAGNVLRFNTVGALYPVWVVRTVQQGPETVINDSFTLLVRGDVDRP